MHTLTLSISWSIPLYPNGEILSYEVMVYLATSSSDVIYSDNVTATVVMQSVMVLPYTDYRVSVSASTSAGQGELEFFTVESPEAGEQMFCECHNS